MTADLSIDELAWLLGLAKGKRKKRERDAPRIQQKPGQSREEFYRARQANQSALDWARRVEDHLILIVGDIDPGQLRDEHRDRYEMLRRNACGKTVYWWDGEYEGQCELPEGHEGDHFDGLSWFNDDSEATDEAHRPPATRP